MNTKPFFLFIFLISGLFIFGQDNQQDKSLRYYNKTEAGFAFGIGSFNTDIYEGVQEKIRNDEMVISLQTINGLVYQGRVGLGVGIGVEKWQHALLFPVFGQVYYDFRPRENTLFAAGSLGSSFGTRDSTNFYHQGKGGFMFHLGFGYKMKVFKRLQFQYELFYKYQAILSSYTNHYTDSTYREIDYKVPLHFLGFRIGISFH